MCVCDQLLWIYWHIFKIYTINKIVAHIINIRKCIAIFTLDYTHQRWGSEAPIGQRAVPPNPRVSIGTPNWWHQRSMQPHWAYSCYACRTECSCRWWHPKQLHCNPNWQKKINRTKRRTSKTNKQNKQTNKHNKTNKTKQNKKTVASKNTPQHLDKLDFFVGQKSHVERERRDQMPQRDCNCMHVLPLLRVVQLPRLKRRRDPRFEVIFL